MDPSSADGAAAARGAGTNPLLSVIDLPPADCGQAAIEGLTMLIADAVRSADDQLVADLDRILRLIERMAEPVHGLKVMS